MIFGVSNRNTRLEGQHCGRGAHQGIGICTRGPRRSCLSSTPSAKRERARKQRGRMRATQPRQDSTTLTSTKTREGLGPTQTRSTMKVLQIHLKPGFEIEDLAKMPSVTRRNCTKQAPHLVFYSAFLDLSSNVGGHPEHIPSHPIPAFHAEAPESGSAVRQPCMAWRDRALVKGWSDVKSTNHRRRP